MKLAVTFLLLITNAVMAAEYQFQRHHQFVLTIRIDDDFQTIKQNLESIVNDPKFYYHGPLLPFQVPPPPEYAKNLYDEDAAGPVDIYRQVAGERNWLIINYIGMIKAYYPDRFRVDWLEARTR